MRARSDGHFRRADGRGQPDAADRSRGRDQGARSRAPSRRSSDRREVSVTTEPRALDDETILERVMVIARNRALAVHHVTVHDLGGKLSVSLDLEVDGKLALARRARDRRRPGSRDRARRSVPRSRSRPISSRCRPSTCPAATRRPNASGRCAHALPSSRQDSASIRQVHDVRVRETGDGEIVNFHCRVDPALHACRTCTSGSTIWSARCAALALDQARDRPRRTAAALTRKGRRLSAAGLGIPAYGVSVSSRRGRRRAGSCRSARCRS